MRDPRVEQYARLLVERCIDVQPRWQVLVRSTPLARPRVEEVVRLIARRGAYVLKRISFVLTEGGEDPIWTTEAPEELLSELPAAELHTLQTIDALIVIVAPENMRDGKQVPADRQALIAKAYEPIMPRIANDEIPWVGCYYPTPAAAQEAGMPLS